jgi:hypothetical protein
MYDETHTPTTQSLPVVIVVNRHRRHLYYRSETTEPTIDHYHLTPYSFQHLLALLTLILLMMMMMMMMTLVTYCLFDILRGIRVCLTKLDPRSTAGVDCEVYFCFRSNEANHTTAAVASLIFTCESTRTFHTNWIYLMGHRWPSHVEGWPLQERLVMHVLLILVKKWQFVRQNRFDCCHFECDKYVVHV